MGDQLTDVRRVASDLTALWEKRRSPRPLVVVLSGSHVKTMESLVDAGPLFGRFNYTARIRPFNYWHAAQMVPDLSLRDKVRAYAAFGGTPRYLAAINTANPLDTNIANLLSIRRVRFGGSSTPPSRKSGDCVRCIATAPFSAPLARGVRHLQRSGRKPVCKRRRTRPSAR